MNMDKLTEATRSIAINQSEGMDAMEMDANEPVIMREDLFSQLKQEFPDLNVEIFSRLLTNLENNGNIKTATNDTITFSSSFVM